MDLKSYSRWHDYTRARDEMFVKTDTAWAPWHVARADAPWGLIMMTDAPARFAEPRVSS
jgi:polyphosphate kinase 2 (PPK2 family)